MWTSVWTYERLTWEKRQVCKGRASLSCLSLCLLSWGFEVINHSGQIYSKTIEQRKTQTEREGEGGEGERERWSTTVRWRGGQSWSEGMKGKNSEIDWGSRKKRDKRGLYDWRTWHQTPVCIAEMQIHERERENGREKIKWERGYK